MKPTRLHCLSAFALTLTPTLIAAAVQPRVERVNLNARPQSDCDDWGNPAVLTEPVERVVACITAGADPNVAFDDGQSILSLFIVLATLERPEAIAVVEALVSAGADVDHRLPTKGGTTPILHLVVSAVAAARDTSVPLRALDALLAAGADVDAPAEDERPGRDGHTALTMATQVKSDDAHRVVEALVRAGADVNVSLLGDNTPLHLALGSPNRSNEMIRALLDAGADIHARSSNGQLPIHVAAKYADDSEMISLLVAAGADVNAPTTDMRETPLHIAAGHNSNREVIDAFLDAGADPNARTNARQTPLHWSVIFARTTTGLEALLAANADPNVLDLLGHLPIEYAEDNKLIRGTGAYIDLIRARLR